MGKYDDIINLPYPPKNKKSSISAEDRAAQFGSFKALTGFEDKLEKQAELNEKSKTEKEKTAD